MKTAGSIVAVLATAMGGLVSQGTPPSPQGEQAAAPTVTLVGCVERVEPPAPPAGTTASPAYKLIDIQPGSGQRTEKLTPDTQYLLEAPAGIKLSDFQNQRIEVTGTLTANPRPADSAQRGAARGAQTPTTTLNVKSAKVVSTECKAPRV
jgi:hypothetical protein